MAQRSVVVAGSAVADLTFRVEALPFPGETATAADLTMRLGGKGANQAVAARRLDVPTTFIGCVGDDPEGHATEADLREAGLDLFLRRATDAPTGRAAVIVDEDGENQIAVHPGANALLAADDIEAAREAIAAAAVYVAQLEVPLEATEAGARLARDADVTTVLNAAPLDPDGAALFPLFDVVVLNRLEAEALTEVGITTLEDALAALRALKDMGATDPMITLGRAGAVFVDQGRPTHAPAPAVEAVDTTGTGDAFVGALAAFLAEGQPLEDAVPHACRYAALAATRPGTRAAYADRRTFEAHPW